MSKDIEKMPSSIATAINEVMVNLSDPLEHDAKNDYQKYSQVLMGS